jgi:hypothetical protein
MLVVYIMHGVMKASLSADADKNSPNIPLIRHIIAPNIPNLVL